MTNAPVPFVTRTDKAKAAAPQADRQLAEAARGADAKAGDAAKPRFDFYKILPGQEVPVTDKELRAAAKAPEKAGAPKDVYFVQAGAFQNPADADGLKARLALAGLVANVEPANLPDKGTWYRVRLGPFTQLDEINRVRATLAQNGVDASLVKIRN
jgi:cell division protein FtsN